MNCFQTAIHHQGKYQSVLEETNEYMHIIKCKLENLLFPLANNKKKTGKEYNGTADNSYP
jgi:hypothetical protein